MYPQIARDDAGGAEGGEGGVSVCVPTLRVSARSLLRLQPLTSSRHKTITTSLHCLLLIQEEKAITYSSLDTNAH